MLGAANAALTGGTSIQNIGRLTMNGTIRLHLSSTLADDIAVGDYIELWRDVNSVTGTPVLDPESVLISAEKGLYWDTTDIAQGILRVAYDPTVGIKAMDNGQLTMEDVYDLSGRQLSNSKLSNRQIHKGVYIINGRKVVIK